MAGKKQEVTRDETIYLRVSKKELEEIKELAEELELPLTTCVRNLVLYAKEDAEFLKKVGVFKGIKKLSGWFKKTIGNEIENKSSIVQA
jgi:hypothetical protein